MHRIALTIGDAAGIGPELLLRSIEHLNTHAIPVIYGDTAILRSAQRDLYVRGIVAHEREIRTIEAPQDSTLEAICVIDCSRAPMPMKSGQYPWGCSVAAFGQLQYDALLRAISDTQDTRTAALVTLPWHKARLLDAQLPATGHTEVLQRETHSPDAIMVLCGDTLRVALQTIHIPLREVPDRITTRGIMCTTRIFAQALARDWAIDAPRIAICGLNPHAGEQNVLGTEDQAVIAPAIRQLQAAGIRAEGPFPADTIFPLVAHGQAAFDGIIAMYHDQGLGPLKTWHFGHAANVTAGMPIIRTSVDHGTAYDIAGTGAARTSSLLYAWGLAATMINNRATPSH